MDGNGDLPATGVRFAGTNSGLSAAGPPAPDGSGSVRRQRKAKEPDIDIGRLVGAMGRSRRVLEYFRTERVKAVRQLVGKHWSENGSDKKVPLNLLALWLQVVSRSLIAKSPRVMATTRDAGQRAAVAAMVEWVNPHLERTYFADELRRWVVDALLSVGIMKVGLAAPSDSAVRGYGVKSGVPFAQVVDLDDWVHDVTAKSFDQCSFMGHRFRVPESVATELGYARAPARELRASGIPRYNAEGDERIGELGRSYQVGAEDEFDPMVELWEIYLPRQRRVVILAGDESGVPRQDQEPLKVTEWFGPDCGPYHFLSFFSVPGNAMPKGPIVDLVDLAELGNRLYRKLGNQAEREKEVLPVRGGQTDDARQLVQARDGEAFGCDNADTIKPVRYGGPSAVNLQFAIHVKDLFSFMGGNLDLLGGRAPQAKTAAQDKLLAQNASAGIADFQDTTVVATSKVMSAVMWFWWYHPEMEMVSTRQAPGVPDVAITRRLYPRGATGPGGAPRGLQRSGRYEDLDLRVDPYSMQYRSPSDRLQFMMGLVQQLGPLLPLLQQQGVVLDAQFMLKKIAEWADEPDVSQLFTVQEPPAAPPGQADQLGGGQPNGGEYVHRSAGSDTQDNREAQLSNLASAQAAQEQRQ